MADEKQPKATKPRVTPAAAAPAPAPKKLGKAKIVQPPAKTIKIIKHVRLEPPPHPKPPAPPQAGSVAMLPQLFLVETYHLRTLRTATGKGPEVSTIQFLPGEEKTIEIRRTVSESHSVTDTTTAMESEDETVAQDFNSKVSSASEKTGSDEANSYNLHGKFHGDASMTFGGGEANAQLDVEGGSNAVRRGFSSAVQNAMDSQVAHTAQSRNQKVSEQASSDKTQKDTSVVSTDKVKNPNPTKAVTAIWYQMVEQFTSFLTLENIDVAFLNAPANPAGIANIKSLRTEKRVPLHSVDNLLGEILDPGKVQEVRNAIKSQLQNVLDYQDKPTDIVEEVISGAKTILRFKKGLQSEYVVKDGDGNPLKTIHVDGLLLKTFTNVLPSGSLTLDLVVGTGDAVTG